MPLHQTTILTMSFTPSASASPQIWQDEAAPSPRALSGLGASRQTRRLQLRNAGFRGPAVPGRKVTPKTESSSTSLMHSSDAENRSPAGTRVNASVGRRKSSGILTEIGNSTLTRPKRTARPRIHSAKFYTNMEGRRSGEYDAAFPTEGMSSPPPPKSSIRPRSAKVRTKLGAKRRSVSGETRQYIDHLEAELAATQTELSAATSPSVTRQHSSKMRNLNAETKHLHDALQEWEDKFDERVQELEDEHRAVEASLKAHARCMEEAAEESKYRIYELEEQMETASQSLEVAESANLQLEKRLEIMSDLLATSAKIDLHAETPGRNKRHTRPKSMLPRFPTTGNLMASPERRSECSIPASPSLSFAGTHHDLHETLSHQEPLEATYSPSVDVSDVESVMSDAYSHGQNIFTVEQSLPTPTQHHEMPPPVIPGTRGRPTRRMRRFGAGSFGPKPLILPSASHLDSTPASAPPMERHETPPHFPFGHENEEHEGSSPVLGRRRASTMADQATLAKLEGAAFLDVPGGDYEDESVLSLARPGSSRTQDASYNLSSLGSCSGAAVSRNLMEELSQLQSTETSDEHASSSGLDYNGYYQDEDAQDCTELADVHTSMLSPIEECQPRELSQTLASFTTAAPPAATLGLRSRSSSLARHPQASTTGASGSYLSRLRALFIDLWRSPVDLARRLFQNAAARMRIPAPLRNVQWWLVTVLLGPMAKRRLLSSRDQHCEHDDERERLLLPATPSLSEVDVDDDLAYGTLYRSPPRMRSRGKCSTHQGFAAHSPHMWLKFSITLAFAIGCAFKGGPASLLGPAVCECKRRRRDQSERKALD